MATRLPPLLDRAILFAHRGARTKQRAHTLDAMVSALRLGATGIHVDAWTTRDDVVVVDRGGLVRRLPRRRIADVDHASVSDVLVSLDELFDAIERVPIRIGATEAAAPIVIDTARRRGQLDRVWLTNDDLDVLARWRDAAPEVRLVNTTSIDALPFGPERRAAELAAARVDAVALPEGDWSGGLTTLFHRFDVLAFADGAHYERQLVRLVDMGIDGLSGDHADRMAAVAATFE